MTDSPICLEVLINIDSGVGMAIAFQQADFCEGRSPCLFRASQQNPSPQPQLGLASVSKAERPFGIA
jgi:hypothetical protein